MLLLTKKVSILYYIIQQAVVIASSTDFKVQCYYGNGKNSRDHQEWENDMREFEVHFAVHYLCRPVKLLFQHEKYL